MRDDGPDQRNHQRLHVAEAPALDHENQQHVQAGDQHAVEERNVKQQVQRNGRADHLGQVAGRNGDLRAHPQRKAHPAPIALVAKLRQVPLRGHAQLQAQALQQNRHQVRRHDDEQQRIAEARAAGDVGGPVAGVHVAHRDQKSRARETPAAAASQSASGRCARSNAPPARRARWAWRDMWRSWPWMLRGRAAGITQPKYATTV